MQSAFFWRRGALKNEFQVKHNLIRVRTQQILQTLKFYFAFLSQVHF